MVKVALRLLLLFCLAGLLFSACSKKKTEDYSGTLLNMPKRAENAAQQADLVALRSSIHAYRAAHGKYPQELRDVAPLLNSDINYGDYDYDPATGQVSVKKAGVNAGNGQ